MSVFEFELQKDTRTMEQNETPEPDMMDTMSPEEARAKIRKNIRKGLIDTVAAARKTMNFMLDECLDNQTALMTMAAASYFLLESSPSMKRSVGLMREEMENLLRENFDATRVGDHMEFRPKSDSTLESERSERKGYSKFEVSAAELMNQFPMGSIMISPGARELLSRAETLELLVLHGQKSWGETPEYIVESNTKALERHGGTVCSAQHKKEHCVHFVSAFSKTDAATRVSLHGEDFLVDLLYNSGGLE